MKKILSTLVAAGALTVCSQAMGAENWTTRLPGVTEGLAVGALPPEGVYFVNDTLYTPTKLYGANGKSGAVHLDAFVDVPIVEWATGIKILGADYAVAIAQPFDHVTTTLGATSNGTNLGSGSGLYDTLLLPAILSWSLPYNFHVSTELGVWVPDGSNDAKMAVRNSNRYWAVEPGIGVSWLQDGWAASVLFTYDFNFEKNADTIPGGTYRSGDQFIAEYSVIKTIGKWSVGVGGYALKQIEEDEAKTASGGAFATRSGAAQKYAIGPMVGYNFGPVIVQAYFHENLKTVNYVGGDEFWTRVLVPF